MAAPTSGLTIKLAAEGTGDLSFARFQSRALPGVPVTIEAEGSTGLVHHHLRFVLGTVHIATQEAGSTAELHDAAGWYTVALTFTGTKITNWHLVPAMPGEVEPTDQAVTAPVDSEA